MGLLALFSKPVHGLMKLPSGSFTIDAAGAVLVSTLPSNFPPTLVKEIADQVLNAFRNAQAAQLPLSELIVNYPSLRIIARHLRGGAIIFLSPRTPYAQTTTL